MESPASYFNHKCMFARSPQALAFAVLFLAGCCLFTGIINMGENKKKSLDKEKKKVLPLFERFYQKQGHQKQNTSSKPDGSSIKYPASNLYTREKCNLIFFVKKEEIFSVYRLWLP